MKCYDNISSTLWLLSLSLSLSLSSLSLSHLSLSLSSLSHLSLFVSHLSALLSLSLALFSSISPSPLVSTAWLTKLCDTTINPSSGLSLSVRHSGVDSDRLLNVSLHDAVRKIRYPRPLNESVVPLRRFEGVSDELLVALGCCYVWLFS